MASRFASSPELEARRRYEEGFAYTFLCARADNRFDLVAAPACGMIDAAVKGLEQAVGPGDTAEFLYQYADSLATRAPMPPLPQRYKDHFTAAPAGAAAAQVDAPPPPDDPQAEERPGRAIAALKQLLVDLWSVKVAVMALCMTAMVWGTAFLVVTIIRGAGL